MNVAKWIKLDTKEYPAIFSNVTVSDGQVKELVLSVDGTPYRIVPGWDNLTVQCPAPPKMVTVWVIRHEIIPGMPIEQKFPDKYKARDALSELKQSLVNSDDIKVVEEEEPES